MTIALIGDREDDSGRITQSSKIYDWAARSAAEQADYRDRVAGAGQRVLFIDGDAPVNIDGVYIGSDGALAERPMMPITVETLTIAAGDRDAAKFRDVPAPCQMAVYASGFMATPISVMQVTTKTIDLSIPTPGRYMVTFSKFPFRDWSREIVVS